MLRFNNISKIMNNNNRKRGWILKKNNNNNLMFSIMKAVLGIF